VFVFIALVIQNAVRMRRVILPSILTLLGSVSDTETQKTEFKFAGKFCSLIIRVCNFNIIFIFVNLTFRPFRKIAKSDYWLRHVRLSGRPLGTTGL
jgi:hypothetical protein